MIDKSKLKPGDWVYYDIDEEWMEEEELDRDPLAYLPLIATSDSSRYLGLRADKTSMDKDLFDLLEEYVGYPLCTSTIPDMPNYGSDKLLNNLPYHTDPEKK